MAQLEDKAIWEDGEVIKLVCYVIHVQWDSYDFNLQSLVPQNL